MASASRCAGPRLHVKLLREADLLRASKHGTRTTYTVDRERLECLFDDVESALLARSAAPV